MLGFLVAKLRAVAARRLPQHLRDGRRGEDLAFSYLRNQGYRIVVRNFRARGSRGEIDLIGWDGDHLACVEVKTRKNADFGRPEGAVGREKRKQLIRASYEYARRAAVDPERLRFDIVAVTLEPRPEIRLYKAAFGRRMDLERRAGLG